jgi:hypothetical protein
VPVVVCPEYAFGSSDWQAIDAVVRAFPGPLIVLGGFGQTKLASLNAIRDVAGEGLRCGWHAEAEADGRPMNFGSAWIKKADGHREVVLYGKNYLEAEHEDLGGVFKFEHLTEIIFEDLRIFPFICADALELPAQGSDLSVSQRVALQVNQSHKPALCIGSLLQPSGQATTKWTSAIAGLLQGLGHASAGLLICNIATTGYDVRTGGELWRNLSGTYVAKRHARQGQKQIQDAAAYFETDAVMAWPLRTTSPQLVFGTLSLPPYSNDQGVLHPWATPPSQARFAIDYHNGAHIVAYPRSGIHDEVLLLTEVTHCKQGDVDLRFKHIETHLSEVEPEDVHVFIARLLGGPLGGVPKQWSVVDLCAKSREALAGSLQCLDAVMEASGSEASDDYRFSWASAASATGETIRLCMPDLPVALWWSGKDSSFDMMTVLRNRAQGYLSGSPLHVFGKGVDGDFDPIDWKEICAEVASATSQLGFDSGAEAEYADLSTVEATPLHHIVKTKGMQILRRLSDDRAANNPQFKPRYVQVVKGVKA